MRINFKAQNMIKEAFDNLPNGVCYFDKNGVPILVNRVMHQLMVTLTERDIQNISDFDGVLEQTAVTVPDTKTVWRFQRTGIGEQGEITEIVATDITELCRRKQELEKGNAEQQDILRRFEKAGENIVSITRNEEILDMKMRIHNDLGYALGVTRQFIASGCPEEKKAEYVGEQRQMARKLLGEIENNDETNVFSDLKLNAEKLGMSIVFKGELPDCAEVLMSAIVRECLINTARHADGDTVFVNADSSGGIYTAVITNNGRVPDGPVVEGGGLSALRKNLESRGGAMKIESTPRFTATITFPLSDEEETP